jgi:puromycin-sensitive aminopeptidase
MESVLLPDHAVPRRYTLHLTPDLVKCTFTGTVAVELDVRRPSSTLTLHAHELSVDPLRARYAPANSNTSPLAASGLAYSVAAQTVTLTFPSELPAGAGVLSLAFAGVLNDELAGFYRSKYASPSGQQRYMAVTQFEATDARRCFPCWDEPAAKAVFAVRVTAPADRLVLSNSRPARVDTSADGATRTWTFADTPVQSTYLVAVVVGEFDCVSSAGRGGIVTSVYTPPGKAALGSFALSTGVAALQVLEDLFRLPYMGEQGMICTWTWTSGAPSPSVAQAPPRSSSFRPLCSLCPCCRTTPQAPRWTTSRFPTLPPVSRR